VRRDIIRQPLVPLDEDAQSPATGSGTRPHLNGKVLGCLLIVALLATGWYLRTYLTDRAEIRNFDNAPICPLTSTAPTNGDCVLAITAWITQVRQVPEERGYTGPSYLLTFADAGSHTYVAGFADSDGVFDMARTGAVVTAYIWHGAVVLVTDDLVTSETLNAPDYPEGLNLGGLVAAALRLLGLTILALSQIARMPGTRALLWTAGAVLVAAISFTVGCWGAALSPGGAHDNLYLGAGLSALVFLGFGINRLVAWRRARRDSLARQQPRVRWPRPPHQKPAGTR
jgi:hypothetical protein